DREGPGVSFLQDAQYVGYLLAVTRSRPAPPDHDPLADVVGSNPDHVPVAHAGHDRRLLQKPCKPAISGASSATGARSSGGCTTSTSAPRASMSSTAASAESIRTQASTQSSRPATECGLLRIRMPGGRPSRV